MEWPSLFCYQVGKKKLNWIVLCCKLNRNLKYGNVPTASQSARTQDVREEEQHARYNIGQVR